MFGNLAAASSSTPGASGFGMSRRGASSSQTHDHTLAIGAFGTPPANNAFGSRPAFGSTGASTFGQPSTFGPSAGGSIFGTGFGSTSTTGASAFGQPPQPQQQNAFGSSTSATNSNVFGKPSGFGCKSTNPVYHIDVRSSHTSLLSYCYSSNEHFPRPSHGHSESTIPRSPGT